MVLKEWVSQGFRPQVTELLGVRLRDGQIERVPFTP